MAGWYVGAMGLGIEKYDGSKFDAFNIHVFKEVLTMLQGKTLNTPYQPNKDEL